MMRNSTSSRLKDRLQQSSPALAVALLRSREPANTGYTASHNQNTTTILGTKMKKRIASIRVA